MKDLDGITRILGNLSNNIYLVEYGDELVVIDPGMPSDLRRVASRIKSLGRSPEEVTAIVLTHFHVDHAGSARALKQMSGATVYLHTDEPPYLQGEKAVPLWSSPGRWRSTAACRLLRWMCLSRTATCSRCWEASRCTTPRVTRPGHRVSSGGTEGCFSPATPYRTFTCCSLFQKADSPTTSD